MTKWKIEYDAGEGVIESGEAGGKLSLDPDWAFIIAQAGHVMLAVPTSKVVAITSVE